MWFHRKNAFTNRSALALFALLLTACSSQITTPPSVSEAEIALGAQDQLALSGYTKRHERLLRVGAKVVTAAKALCSEWNIHHSNCDADFRLDPKRTRFAYTDGDIITFSYAMMNFAKTDDQLAIIIGHELAHNLANHVIAGRMGGTLVESAAALLELVIDPYLGNVDDPILRDGSEFVTGELFNKEQEREADYISLYLAHNAGYNIDNAENTWRQFAKSHIDGIYEYNHTHPNFPERYLILQKTVAEIRDKEARGEAILPNKNK